MLFSKDHKNVHYNRRAYYNGTRKIDIIKKLPNIVNNINEKKNIISNVILWFVSKSFKSKPRRIHIQGIIIVISSRNFRFSLVFVLFRRRCLLLFWCVKWNKSKRKHTRVQIMDACKSLGVRRLVIYGTVFICLHKLRLTFILFIQYQACILNLQAVNFTIKCRSRRYVCKRRGVSL